MLEGGYAEKNGYKGIRIDYWNSCKKTLRLIFQYTEGSVMLLCNDYWNSAIIANLPETPFYLLGNQL